MAVSDIAPGIAPGIALGKIAVRNKAVSDTKRKLSKGSEDSRNWSWWWLALPPRRSSLLGNLRPMFLSKARSASLSAHAPKRHGGGVLAVIRGHVFDLAHRDLGDHDGAGVHVGGALFALWASGHPRGALRL